MKLEYHSIIDNELWRIQDKIFFNENILEKPIVLDTRNFDIRNFNFSAIQNFLTTILNIFNETLYSETEFAKIIRNLLLNDSIQSIPISFYKSLDEKIWTTPKFYRTDESKEGKVFEIQCPGSGWGDVILLEKLYKEIFGDAFIYYDLQNSFFEEVKKITKTVSPSIMHLLDNSSNPSSMRYFMNETSKNIRYWGMDKSVKNNSCELIRSHSVYGLIFENLFKIRMEKVKNGECNFDLPPFLIFDQKMILSLPFLDLTKHLFSDDIRETLSYTYPFTTEGFRDITGEWVTVDLFKKRKPKDRKYFLKYGGCDTSINWGSRAVFRLDSNSCNEHIELALSDYSNNRPWIIQKDCSNKDEVRYFERGNSQIQSKRLTAKYSTFYSPSGMLAIRTHHGQSTKVHGQEDSIAGMAYKQFENE